MHVDVLRRQRLALVELVVGQRWLREGGDQGLARKKAKNDEDDGGANPLSSEDSGSNSGDGNAGGPPPPYGIEHPATRRNWLGSNDGNAILRDGFALRRSRPPSPAERGGGRQHGRHQCAAHRRVRPLPPHEQGLHHAPAHPCCSWLSVCRLASHSSLRQRRRRGRRQPAPRSAAGGIMSLPSSPPLEGSPSP